METARRVRDRSRETRPAQLVGPYVLPDKRLTRIFSIHPCWVARQDGGVNCGLDPPRPSPRRWLRSKVASASSTLDVFLDSFVLRHVALTIALISFRKNPAQKGGGQCDHPAKKRGGTAPSIAHVQYAQSGCLCPPHRLTSHHGGVASVPRANPA